MHRELQEPVLGVDNLIDGTMKPRFEYLFAVIGEMLDLPPDERRVKLTAISIHGLILMFHRNPIVERFGQRMRLDFTPEQITEHVVAFSLAALGAYRQTAAGRSGIRAPSPRLTRRARTR